MDNVDQGRFVNQQSQEELLTAAQAAELLGVKPATLYAYVSRGLLRSMQAEKGRGHRYARSEVLRLKGRAEARSGHGAVAAAALDFGEPVLQTAISAVDAQGPRYRGFSAVNLAQQGTSFEAVAELLWNGNLPPSPPRWSVAPALHKTALLSLIPPGTPPLFALALLVPALALGDAARFSAPPEAEKERARQLLFHLAAGLALGGQANCERFAQALQAPSIAAAVALALGHDSQDLPQETVLSALNSALVIMADHELNMSTFAARIAASAGADLYACFSAALAALAGPRHGGACDRVEALLAEAQRLGDSTAVINDRLRRGEVVPSFGHPLYPDGDPRTPPLLALVKRLEIRNAGVDTLLALVAAMHAAGYPPPTVDIGLVALTTALRLPAGAAACLFAIGRTAGWVAHILEQRQSSIGLRPRARYIGHLATANEKVRSESAPRSSSSMRVRDSREYGRLRASSK